MKSLAQGDVAPFVSFVKDYLITTISYFDFHQQEKEQSYQLLILGMVAYFANTHHARSNRESGKGRYDISLAPKNKARKGIIMELKVADEGEELTQVAQKAFDQLQSRQYKTDMEARGVQDFVLLGMAFRGKEVKAVTHQMMMAMMHISMYTANANYPLSAIRGNSSLCAGCAFAPC